MYCFSRICRICLTSSTDQQNLNSADTDNIKINDKLIFCIPEIFNPYDNLPETICVDCYQFIRRMYEFKQICIDNTIKLNKYASKLSNTPGVFNKNNLVIKIERNLKIDELLAIRNSNIKVDSDFDLTDTEDSSVELNENQTQSEIQTSPSSEIRSSPQLDIEKSPQLEIQLRPQLEREKSPHSEIQRSPQLEIEKKSQFEREKSPQLEIQTSPQSELKSSPILGIISELKTSPILEIPTSPQNELKTSPILEIPTSPQSQLKTSPILKIPTSPQSLLKTSPILEIPTSPKSESKTSSILEIPTSPQSQLKTSPILEIPTSPKSELKTSPILEIPTSPKSESKTSPILEIPTSPKSESKTSPILEIPTSPQSEIKLSPILEIQNRPHFKIQTSPESKKKSRPLVIHSDSETITASPSSTNSHSLSEATPTKEVSMYSVSLNKWDSFETKYTCRCIKEFSSFTENTQHLCNNCKGELLGFRLSKIKTENRFTSSFATVKQEQEEEEDDDENSDSYDESDGTDFETTNERGFNYNDVLLSKAHINGVKKHINQLEDKLSPDDDKTNSKLKSSKYNKHTCNICEKIFPTRYFLNKHFLSHKDYLEKSKVSNKLARQKQFLTPTTSKSLRIDEETDSEEDEIEYEEEDEEEDDEEYEEEYEDEEEHNFSKSSNDSDLNSSSENVACGTCDKVFSSKGKLAIHLMTHVGRKEYKCSTCDKEFFRKENYDLHMESHQSMSSSPISTNIQYTCPHCDKTKDNVNNMRRHIREVHLLRKFNCIICNAICDDKDMLEQHTIVEHTLDEGHRNPKKYPCPHCNKILFAPTNVRKHMREAHDIQPKHICAICHHVFDDNETLDEHIFDEHTLHEVEYKPKMKQKEKPVKHIKHEEQPQPMDVDDQESTDMLFQCPKCNKTYRHDRTLRRHIKEKHESFTVEDMVTSENEEESEEEQDFQTELDTKKLTCPHCFKMYHSVKSVRRHVREVHGLVEFFCSFCNEIFTDKQTLDEHTFLVHDMTNYDGEEEEEEKEQEDRDDNKNNQQEMIHEDRKHISESAQTQKPEKKYKCTLCEKRYHHASNVQRHMKDSHSVHKMKNKYLCSICNETFIEKHILEKHIFSVHTQGENKNASNEDKQKVYPCPVCHKRFNHLSNLRMHALSHDELESSVEYKYCNICKKHISKRSNMNKHIQTHMRDKIHECSACAAKFDNLWVLRQHRKSKHPNFNPTFKCPECSKTYSSKFSLKKHRFTTHTQ